MNALAAAITWNRPVSTDMITVSLSMTADALPPTRVIIALSERVRLRMLPVPRCRARCPIVRLRLCRLEGHAATTGTTLDQPSTPGPAV
jgi:hypothetical protein